MSTAEISIDQEQLDAEHSFKMPEVKQGTPIRFYPASTLDPGMTTLGFVKGISRSGRTINVYVPGIGNYEQVRHITDPKLRMSPEQRENGAWDFTPYHQHMQQFLTEISERVVKLEEMIGDES